MKTAALSFMNHPSASARCDVDGLCHGRCPSVHGDCERHCVMPGRVECESLRLTIHDLSCREAPSEVMRCTAEVVAERRRREGDRLSLLARSRVVFAAAGRRGEIDEDVLSWLDQ